MEKMLAAGNIMKDVELDDFNVKIDEIDQNMSFLCEISVKKTKYVLFEEKTYDYCTKRVFVYLKEPYKGYYESVADIPLEKKTVGGLTTYHPSYTQIDNKHQGKGLAKHFYIAISKHLGIKIRSGETQSIGSVKLWYNLAKSRRVKMYGYRRKHGWSAVIADNKNKEVFCSDFDPYENMTDALVMVAE